MGLEKTYGTHGYKPQEIYNNGIYVAGSVKNNKERISDIQEILSYLGWRVTYDWTKADQERIWTDPAYREQLITAELYGIQTADAFLLALPGGRGAHVELGYALAQNKKIFILAQNEEQLKEVMIYNKGSFVVCYSLSQVLYKLDKAAKWKDKVNPYSSLSLSVNLPPKDKDDPIPF